MFVYLLIAAEIAILYTVFWYVYVREPKEGRRIQANLWGTYQDAHNDTADPTLPFLLAQDRHSVYEEAYVPVQGHEIYGDYILDPRTNRYVRPQEVKGVLNRMASSIDRTFSQINVKP
jgi:hypothetical protein